MKNATKTVPIGPFRGINNRLPDAKLSTDEGDWLRNAINVDLTDAGTLQRRKGGDAETSQAGTDCHSLWADGAAAYYVDGTTLYRYPRTEIKTGLRPGQRVSYATLPNGEVIWSNGIVLERIAGGVSRPAALPTPNPAPSVSAATGGSLPAGYYLVAITASNDAGEESGATWPAQVAVPADGRIEIDNLPGTPVSIYLSSLNGEVLLHAAETSATSYAFPLMPTLGRQLLTAGLRPLPPGQIVRHYDGRTLVAADNLLYIGEPYAVALYNPARGYVPLPERITMVRPCGSGIYIATTSKTWWMTGADAATAQLVEVLPYGAVESTDSATDSGEEVWWFSRRGIVIGSPGGEVKNIQEGSVAVAPAQSGATLYRDHNGMRQMLASLFGADLPKSAVSTWINAEIIRKEEA